jgi:hypothetical protein
MNAPPYPEPVNAPREKRPDGSVLLHAAPPLRRFPIAEAPGFAVEVTDRPEAVYLLGTPDGTEIPVPCRLCGTWNPATISGRHFFYAWEPDVALELTSVRRVTCLIGRLAFPSGWAASPWFANTSRRTLLRQLSAFTAAFLDERLTKSSALARAVAKTDLR